MNFVLDANALIAYLEDEPGAELVDDLLNNSENTCYVHAINLCEVYYGTRRVYGDQPAESALVALEATGLIVREDIDEDFWKEAGRIKADYHKVSLADCLCITLANRLGAEVVTSDHHAFDPLVKQNICKARFIR